MRPTVWLTPALLAAVVAGLTACAPAHAPLSTASGATANGAPLPVDGYDWFLNDDPHEPRLSYGLAQSDDVPLNLSCAPGSGQVALSLAGEHDPARRLTLESGGETEAYPAHVETDMHDGAFLLATASTSDPVIQRFRRLGWLAVLSGEERWMMAAQPGSEGRAARFLDLCA